MGIAHDEPFIKLVESLIDPAEVSDLGFIQRFKCLMPRSLFKKLLYRTSKKFPRIGFIIEPYSFFLFFRLKDIERAKAMLPARYELVKTSIVDGGESGYFQGMGIFSTRGSTFWGVRLESYLIARDRQTGLVSWIFIDILSNTLIARPSTGIADRNCRHAVHTTNSKGELFIDVREDGTGRALKLKADLFRGKPKRPDQPLWIGGNTSIAYTEALSGGDDSPFAVIFDPAEVSRTLVIPVEDVRLEENTLSPGLAESEPCMALCFPYAQHYIADSPGCRTCVKDEADLEDKYRQIAGTSGMRTFSTGPVKKLFLAGFLLSLAGTLSLLAAFITVSL